MNKQLVIIGIIILLIIIGLSPSISATENAVDMIDWTTKVKIVNESDYVIEEIYTFQNFHDFDVNSVVINLTVPWFYSRGDTRTYDSSGNDWKIIEKDTPQISYTKDFKPFEYFEVHWYRFIPDFIHKSENTYTIHLEAGITNSPVHNIEVKIPTYLGRDKLKILNYASPPNNEGFSSDYYVMTWQLFPMQSTGISSGQIVITYTYEFSWSDLINNPYFSGFILFIFGVFLGFVWKTFKIKYSKKHKQNNGSSNEKLLKVLKLRYAKGEITKKEYEQMKKDIES